MSIILKIMACFPLGLGDRIMKFFWRNKQGTSKLLRKYYKQKYNVDVGEYTYGGCFESTFNQGGNVTIGRYCSIANNVHYFGANHPLNMISTSAYFYNKKFSGKNVKDVPRNKLVIGNDVWIGYGTLITPGCKNIGTGAVIGAGSVVTHDVPENAIVAGNPARLIRYRQSKELFEELKQTCWWSKELECLMKYYEQMNDIKLFCETWRKQEK